MALRDFCTVSDVKKFLDVRAGTVSDDPLIQLLVTAVSAGFRTIMNREVLTADYDEVRDGSGSPVLMMPNYPITAVSAVELGSPSATRSPLVVNTDYVFSKWAIKLVNGGNFPRGIANVRVAYTAGLTTVPFDLAEKAAKTAALRYKQLNRLGQTSKSIGGETVNFDTSDLPKDVMSTLENYAKRIQV